MLGALKPGFKTIVDFRRDNRAAFRGVFRQFVLLCRRLDLNGRELLAVDGTRIKAVNNKDRNFPERCARSLRNHTPLFSAKAAHVSCDNRLVSQSNASRGGLLGSAHPIQEPLNCLRSLTGDRPNGSIGRAALPHGLHAFDYRHLGGVGDHALDVSILHDVVAEWARTAAEHAL